MLTFLVLQTLLSLYVIAHANESRRSKVFIHVCLCVCVCPRDRTKTAETTVTKLATGIVIMSPGCPFNIRSEVKVTGSQSASDQVAGVR